MSALKHLPCMHEVQGSIPTSHSKYIISQHWKDIKQIFKISFAFAILEIKPRVSHMNYPVYIKLLIINSEDWYCGSSPKAHSTCILFPATHGPLSTPGYDTHKKVKKKKKKN